MCNEKHISPQMDMIDISRFRKLSTFTGSKTGKFPNYCQKSGALLAVIVDRMCAKL